MKNTTRILALLLALVLTLGLSATAFADEVHAGSNGTITIDDAIVGQTYTIYEILYLESYNAASGAYSYKATAAWSDFINSAAVKGVYVNVDDQGYVTWIDGKDAAAFAKAALAYASENVANQGSKDADGATVTFENLELGYYLLDSSLGTLCSLNTTNPDATVKEKNAVPTNKKEVQEDSTEKHGTVNDAEIGQTVSFRSTVTLPVGSQNVTFHDTMSTGLTLNIESIKVYTDAALTTALSEGHYTVTAPGTDGCSFDISFTEAYLNGLTSKASVYVGYTAVLSANAVVGGAGNPNTSHVSYGERNNSTPGSTTKTYTWSFDVLKYGNGNESKLLNGAQFVLLNSERKQVAKFQDGKLNGWESVPAAGKDDTVTWPAEAVMTTEGQGKIAIIGLDAGTYYLREIKAPDGYNTLKDDVSVEIKPEAGNDAQGGDTLTLAAITAKVNNQSGTELPSTGGVGTTVFYVLGGILAVGAAVLLIARKRAGRA